MNSDLNVSVEFLETDEVTEETSEGFAEKMSKYFLAWERNRKALDGARTRPKTYGHSGESTRRRHRKRARDEKCSLLTSFFHPKRLCTPKTPVFVNMHSLAIHEAEVVSGSSSEDEAGYCEDQNTIDYEEDIGVGAKEDEPVQLAHPPSASPEPNQPFGPSMYAATQRDQVLLLGLDPSDDEGEDLDELTKSIWNNRAKIATAGEKLLALKKKHHNQFDKVVDARIVGMITMINFYTSNVCAISWTRSSMMAAIAANRGVSFARNLRKWTIAYIQGGFEYLALPLTHYQYFSTKALDDEDLSQRIKHHLQGLGKHFSAQDIVDFVARPEMQGLMGTRQRINVRTAQRWLNNSYRFTYTGKGMYVDGHERPDVVAYRKKFVAQWLAWKRRMMQFMEANEDCDHRFVVPDLQPGESRLILVTHDESTFYQNDRRRKRWVANDEKTVPATKGEGPSVMVSEFASPDFGRLKDTQG
jgi:hypothetical protein